MNSPSDYGPAPPELVSTAHRPGARGPGRAARYLLGIVSAAALVVAGGSVGAAVALHYDHDTIVASAPPRISQSGTGPSQTLAQAARIALPSVVSISVTTDTSEGEGSGVIIRSDGTILTNNHVIDAAANGAGTIRVHFADGKSADAVIVGRDAAADIAVIRAIGVSGATAARLGSVAGLHIGDTVLAIGSPLGLAGTVTSGIVSALHRTVEVGKDQNPSMEPPLSDDKGTIKDVIQTDTAINPGNSGGALIDINGQVVGITTAIASLGTGYVGQQSGSIGVGFAIPIDTAYRIAMNLLKNGSGG